MTRPTTILPEDWPRPKGYANGMTARGQLLAIAGMIKSRDAESRHGRHHHHKHGKRSSPL